MLMADKTRRGLFVVFEGCDRSGKSTQAKLLAERLPNSVSRRFPRRTGALGSLLDSYLRGSDNLKNAETAHLLFSADRWDASRDILAQLNQGQNGKNLSKLLIIKAAQGLDLGWCMAPDRGLPKPDLVIYFDLDPSVAAQRSDYGNERFEKVELQARVRQLYMQLKDDTWIVLDADASIEELHERVFQIVESARACAAKECGTLWK